MQRIIAAAAVCLLCFQDHTIDGRGHRDVWTSPSDATTREALLMEVSVPYLPAGWQIKAPQEHRSCCRLLCAAEQRWMRTSVFLQAHAPGSLLSLSNCSVHNPAAGIALF